MKLDLPKCTSNLLVFVNEELPVELLQARNALEHQGPIRLLVRHRVALQTERGTLKVRVHLTEAARPDVVFIPTGLGHGGFDSFIRGKGVNANKILVAQQDQVTGLATWWGTRVKISKV